MYASASADENVPEEVLKMQREERLRQQAYVWCRAFPLLVTMSHAIVLTRLSVSSMVASPAEYDLKPEESPRGDFH